MVVHMGLSKDLMINFMLVCSLSHVLCWCCDAEVEGQFLPWLMDETVKMLDQKILARALLDCKQHTHTHTYTHTLRLNSVFSVNPPLVVTL